MTTYPTRARIVNPANYPNSAANQFAESIGAELKQPAQAVPHEGKEGLAERTEGGVRITLDDGTILYGYECWWEPIS